MTWPTTKTGRMTKNLPKWLRRSRASVPLSLISQAGSRPQPRHPVRTFVACQCVAQQEGHEKQEEELKTNKKKPKTDTKKPKTNTKKPKTNKKSPKTNKKKLERNSRMRDAKVHRDIRSAPLSHVKALFRKKLGTNSRMSDAKVPGVDVASIQADCERLTQEMLATLM